MDFIAALRCSFHSQIGVLMQCVWVVTPEACMPNRPFLRELCSSSSAHQPGPQLHQPGCAGAQLSPGSGRPTAPLRDQGDRTRQLHLQLYPHLTGAGGEDWAWVWKTGDVRLGKVAWRLSEVVERFRHLKELQGGKLSTFVSSGLK